MHASLARPGTIASRNTVLLHAVTSADAPGFLARQPGGAWARASGFAGEAGVLAPLGEGKGRVTAWVLGLGTAQDSFALATAATRLPPGLYRLGQVPDWCSGAQGVLGWVLGTYSFDRYRAKTKTPRARLVLPPGVNGASVSRIAGNLFLGRDLINTPANDMGPAELEAAARALAGRHAARVRVVKGAALARGYPLITAVGQGSARAPRLIEIVWGNPRAPRVTLVGKGVCFDTGGYDLKPSAGMATMKKDMGGAACVLAVAGMVMDAGLKLRLRVLIGAVENSVSDRAMRPGDVFMSRKGLSVEIGNTDAEGRLVLADALTDADAQAPDLLLDVATLTGAARMATGFEVPPFFTDDERLAADLGRLGMAVDDPLWRLPLWRGYEDTLKSPIADINNNPSYRLAGAVTAALFLNRFVEKAGSWLHLDIPGWIDRPRPGRPLGGEVNGARALYALLGERYG